MHAVAGGRNSYDLAGDHQKFICGRQHNCQCNLLPQRQLLFGIDKGTPGAEILHRCAEHAVDGLTFGRQQLVLDKGFP